MSAIIKAVVDAYWEVYQPQRTCSCGDGEFVEINGLTLPATCMSCEWSYQKDRLSIELSKQGVTITPPMRVKKHPKLDKALSQISHERITSNPMHIQPYPVLVREPNPDNLAANLAYWLSQEEETEEGTFERDHIVVYLDRSFVISETYRRKDDEMREVIMKAPWLVFWDNPDTRNGSWIMNAIRSRQYGTAFVVE